MLLENLLQEVAADLYQVHLPLPFALNRVNCYLLRGAMGWTIVDCGINTLDGRLVWREVFNALNIVPTQIEQIVLTHVHPDHFGLSGWLQSLGADVGHTIPVRCSPREDLQASRVWRSDLMERFDTWLMQNGMPADFARLVANGMSDTRQMTFPHPPVLEPIHAGTTIRMGEREFKMIHAPGHSDGQLLFYHEAEQLILSGDHVLMKITPNIGLWTQTDPHPLANYMQSLGELQTLAVRLALPGHKSLITDWRGRIEELLHHHEERLLNTLIAVNQGAATPYEVSLRIFESGNFSPHEWRFAIAESLAHLDHLASQGKVRQDQTEMRFLPI